MHPSFGTPCVVGGLQGALGLPHRDGVEVQGVMIAGLKRLDLHMLLGDPGEDAFDGCHGGSPWFGFSVSNPAGGHASRPHADPVALDVAIDEQLHLYTVLADRIGVEDLIEAGGEPDPITRLEVVPTTLSGQLPDQLGSFVELSDSAGRGMNLPQPTL